MTAGLTVLFALYSNYYGMVVTCNEFSVESADSFYSNRENVLWVEEAQDNCKKQNRSDFNGDIVCKALPKCFKNFDLGCRYPTNENQQIPEGVEMTVWEDSTWILNMNPDLESQAVIVDAHRQRCLDAGGVPRYR